MTLKEVEIFDFKSIKHETLDLNTSQLCFVGINECGKTSILEAISYLNILDKQLKKGLLNKSSKKYPNGFPQISAVFSLSKKECTDLEGIINTASDESISHKETIDGNEIELKRWGNG